MIEFNLINLSEHIISLYNRGFEKSTEKVIPIDVDIDSIGYFWRINFSLPELFTNDENMNVTIRTLHQAMIEY